MTYPQKGTVDDLKKRLSNYLTRIKSHYNHAGKDFLLFDENYTFESVTTICNSDKEILGAISSHRWIIRIQLRVDCVSIRETVVQQFDYEPHWRYLESICTVSSQIYASHKDGVSIISFAGSTNFKNVSNNDHFNANRLVPYKGGVLITDSVNRKIWSISSQNPEPHHFCGTGCNIEKGVL